MMSSRLISEAKQVLINSHSPYSQFKVGCSILADNNKIYHGCNIENSSFGLTLCAEACAISGMIVDGSKRIQEVAIVNSNDTICPPCGACRQLLSEFTETDCKIHLENNNVIHTYLLSKLLPLQFKL